MAVCAIGTISMVPVALAYSGLGADGGITLEEHLELATRKVERTQKRNIVCLWFWTHCKSISSYVEMWDIYKSEN